MCKVITPGEEHDHGPVCEPAGIAELLRESLVGELETTGDLIARMHMIELYGKKVIPEVKRLLSQGEA